MNEFFANINGIKICYELHGKKENFPLICVHGFGGKKETWIAQIPMLSKHFQVIIFDQRSAGKSDRPDEPFTMETLADDIAGLMDYLHISKAHFLGFSLGGMIIQNFALKYPSLIEKIVLINTSPGIPRKGGIELFRKNQLERIEAIKKDPEQVLWSDIKRGFHISFRKKMKANPKMKFYGIWSVEDLINYIKNNPSTEKDVENQIYALKSHDTWKYLHDITHETLLIAASHDKLTPLSVMEQIHKKLPNSKLHVIQNAGHELHHSRAPEVNKLIIEFLRK
ncbi:MAG: alpha/beta fold hydrolase [Promethearchaeota archaeon]